MAERAIQSGAQWIDGSARRPMVCSRSVIRGRTIPKRSAGQARHYLPERRRGNACYRCVTTPEYGGFH